MIRYFCDGCSRELAGEELTSAHEHAKKNDRVEFFCPSQCQKWSSEYWEGVVDVEVKASDIHDRTLKNFRNQFFAKKTYIKKVG